MVGRMSAPIPLGAVPAADARTGWLAAVGAVAVVGLAAIALAVSSGDGTSERTSQASDTAAITQPEKAVR
jgi:hypothetical protein